LTEQRIQPVKDRAALLDQFAIITQRLAQAVDDRIETRRFKTVKLVILQINVMNNFSNLTQTFAIAQPESFEDRLERAILTMMSELGPIHVEGNCACDRSVLGHKVKTWTLVDELPDQPGRSQPVDVQVASRDCF